MNLDNMLVEMMLNDMLMDMFNDIEEDTTEDFVGQVVQLFSVGTLSEVEAIRTLNGLLTEDFIALFGNEDVESEEQLVEILESIETGVADNLIQLKMIADGCTEKVAITRLALQLNLQPQGETWFKEQMAIVENNTQILENLDSIAENYPRVYSKLYSSENYTAAYKCLEFIMVHFKERLEHLGMFFKPYKESNLFASVSFNWLAESTRCKYGTVRNNVSTLDKIGLVKKLTDEEVEELSHSYYLNLNQYKTRRFHSSITTYSLVEWTEEVLESANNFLANARKNKTGQAGTTYQTEKARGNKTTLSKVSNKKMSKKDKEAINSLKKWARQRINEEGSAHFFTKADFESRFNNKDKKGTIYAGKIKQTTYLKILVAQLDLVAIQPSKANKAALAPYLSSKVNHVNYRKDIFISRTLFEKINETTVLTEVATDSIECI